jgi:hypothetical protein
MKILSPKVHGILDYVVVVIFLASPGLLGLTGLPAVIAYALGGIHLAWTLGTDFPAGLVPWVPLRVHGAIEFVVSLTLPALPWLLRFAADTLGRNFYVGAGAVIFVTWLITDYRATAAGSDGD